MLQIKMDILSDLARVPIQTRSPGSGTLALETNTQAMISISLPTVLFIGTCVRGILPVNPVAG